MRHCHPEPRLQYEITERVYLLNRMMIKYLFDIWEQTLILCYHCSQLFYSATSIIYYLVVNKILIIFERLGDIWNYFLEVIINITVFILRDVLEGCTRKYDNLLAGGEISIAIIFFFNHPIMGIIFRNCPLR